MKTNDSSCFRFILFVVIALTAYYAVLRICTKAYGSVPLRIVVNDPDINVAKANREYIENMALGGGTVNLPAGTVHLDRSLLLSNLHSGCTIKGNNTILRSSHPVGAGVNCSMALFGTGVTYAQSCAVVDGNYVLTLPIADSTEALKPGNVVYAFIYDSYNTLPQPLPRKRHTIKSYDPVTKVLILNEPINPLLTTIKWMEGHAITNCSEGIRAVQLIEATPLPAGRHVYITDGPTVANESRGEYNKVLVCDPIHGVVTLETPLSRAYDSPAIALVDPVIGVTIKNLTLGQPIHAGGQPFYAKQCIDLKLENVTFWALGEAVHQTGFANSGRVSLINCRTTGCLTINNVHNVLIDGGEYGGIYGEEACTTTKIRNLTIKQDKAVVNGITWVYGTEKLMVERVRIIGFGDWHPAGGTTCPLGLQGRQNVLRDVTISNSVYNPGYTASYLFGDDCLVERLVSDVPTNIESGKRWKINNSQTLGWVIKAGTSGTLTRGTPEPSVTPKDWKIIK